MTTPDWHNDTFPELRPGPPWVMADMIAAQPAVIGALLESPPEGSAPAARALAEVLAQGLPVTVCGCGTSEHAAAGVAALLAAAVDPGQAPLVRPRASLTAVLDPAPGACLAISHDGETRATNLALLAAAAAGARTIAVTQQADSSAARAAERVLLTRSHDDSWCHTLAYTSALAVGAGLAGQLGRFDAGPAAARQLLLRVTDPSRVAPIAGHLADRRVVLCAGAGVDHTTARELALKIAEGSRLATLALELETVLHGQLAGQEPTDALIIVALADHAQRERIARRAGQLARAVSVLGLPVAGILSTAYDALLGAELTPAGRVVVELPDPALLHPAAAGLLAGAGALQTLTLELAHARQVNPDLIRREQAPYRSAAQAAESSADW
jgi:glutamine---fructose-6-phosphate transaminase (isomerizing)